LSSEDGGPPDRSVEKPREKIIFSRKHVHPIETQKPARLSEERVHRNE
jgi:hypothetical protein